MNEQAGSVTSSTSGLSFPAVLHFLHHEWRQFEAERNQWEIEKQEFKLKIASLEGEKRGFEILKSDLLRRIKMLEYALKQERAKYLKSSAGEAPKEQLAQSQQQQGSKETLSQPAEKKEMRGNYSAATLGRSMTLGKRTGASKTREILKQYLQEVGYNEKDEWGYLTAEDNFASFRSGGSKYHTLNLPKSSQPFQQHTQPQPHITSLFLKPQAQELELSQPRADQQQPLSPVTETAPEEKKTRRQQVTESVIYESKEVEPISPVEEKPNSSAGAWDTVFASPGDGNQTVVLNSKMLKEVQGWNSVDKKAVIKKPPQKHQTIASPAIVGELADLTIADEKQSQDSTTKTSNEPKLWRPKLSLRSHMDSITTMAFHPNDLCLVTGSEDATIKFWNLETVAGMKKPPMDIEPVYTYRGHQGPVRSVALSTLIPTSADADVQERMQYGALYSAGNDGLVRVWGLPEKQLSPFSKYDYNKYAIAKFQAHSDIVWDVKLHPLRPLLGTISADAFVSLWDLNIVAEYPNGPELAKKAKLLSFGLNGLEGEASTVVPTSIDFVHTDLKQLIVSFTNSQLRLYDIETGKFISSFQKADETYDNTPNTQINKVVTHSTMPLAITAHEDRGIRFFDTRSFECSHSMVAHLDSVSSLDISPNGLVLVSGGHDSSTRVWDISSHACLQEFTSHRKKFDESIQSVVFHPRLNQATNSAGTSVNGGSAWLATCGSDACAKIYHCS